MSLPILAISKLCQDVSFTNFGLVGQCLVESTLFGDVGLAGLLIFVMFTALVVRYNFPITIMLPVGISLSYVLWLMTASALFMGIFILSLIIGGAVLIIGLIQYLNR